MNSLEAIWPDYCPSGQTSNEGSSCVPQWPQSDPKFDLGCLLFLLSLPINTDLREHWLIGDGLKAKLFC